MNLSILIILFVLLISSGCTKPRESFEGTIHQSINSQVIEETIQTNNNNGEIKALKDAQEFIATIKEKDAAKLLQILNTSQLDIEGAKKIIEGFDVNYNLDILSAQINYDGFAMDPEGGQYEFILVDKDLKENDGNNSLVIRYDEDGSIIYNNPYIQYFPYAEKMVFRYLELIGKGDSTELARFLNPDDIVVPHWVAKKTITNYKGFFDPGNMSIHYINHFTFISEDVKGREHVIEVTYGDGLMNIKDAFIPDF